jgi:hypothetical protein
LKKIGLPFGDLSTAGLAPILLGWKFGPGGVRETPLETTPGSLIIGLFDRDVTPGRVDFGGFCKTLRKGGKTGVRDSKTIVITGIDANRFWVIFTSPAGLLLLSESSPWVSTRARSGASSL